MAEPTYASAGSGDRPDDAVVGPASAHPLDPKTLTDAGGQPPDRGRRFSERLFDSPSFFRLWLAQVVSSLGDWIGFVAVTSVAARIGGSSPEAAISLVLSARLIPGFFLAPMAGVLIDRWDRKKVMVACDIGRGLVMVGLPWVDTIPGLFFASLLLEILTLMWGPAKDASVPNLVRPGYLATANSLGLVAAYGTFPIGALVFGSLTKVGERVLDLTGVSGLPQETVPLLFDAGTYVLSGLLIATLALPRARARRVAGQRGLRVSETLRELREGWQFIGKSRVVRSVMFGIATGLIGGGMLVPLGKPFVEEVLGGGPAGFGLLLAALGTGVAAGIVALSVAQSRLPHERLFTASVLGAGASIIAATSTSTLTPAIALVALLGVFAGAVYVLGFTILQGNVEDDLRGRTFAAFYTLIRLCLLLAFAIAGVLSGLLGQLAERTVGDHVLLFDLRIAVPGVRLALWLAGLIILSAGAYTRFALRSQVRVEPTSPLDAT